MKTALVEAFSKARYMEDCRQRKKKPETFVVHMYGPHAHEGT